ncbi:MAG: hypothetical protein GY754_27865 [bacterium]|nr:hypothetical protein [bacterium]
MIKMLRVSFGLIILLVLSFSGCEAGLTGGNSSGDPLDDHFSFSEIYTRLNSMEAEIVSLNKQIAEYDRIFAGLSREKNDLKFNGVNVHILNGSGSTSGEVNGLGNLVVGYNEERDSDNVRSGSHNIIVGERHNYSSYGGFVGGYNNAISGTYSSVSGGTENSAETDYSTVTGTKLQVRYNTCLEGIGWQGWVSDGAVSGTMYQYRRVEAIMIEVNQ